MTKASDIAEYDSTQPPLRTCRVCGQDRKLSKFSPHGGGRRRVCRVCRKWLARGVTQEEIQAAVWVCRGCDSTDLDDLKMDHDHATGIHRGILCNHCNLALGHARDSARILRNLADYLDQA